MPIKNKHKLGVAASGGSTKIFFQAGVSAGLQDLNLDNKITYWSGTSSGALLAAAMTTLSPHEFADFLIKNVRKKSDVFLPTWYKFWDFKGLYSLKPVKEKLERIIDPKNPRGVESVSCSVHIGDSTYEKFYVSNCDTEFKLWSKFVLASATISGLMELDSEDFLWVDGGFREYVPIRHSLTRCEKVISIATSRRQKLEKNIKKNNYYWPIKGFLYFFNSFEGGTLKEIKINDYLRACEDDHVFSIEPEEDLNVGMTEVPDPKKSFEIFTMGREQVHQMKKELLEFLAV